MTYPLLHFGDEVLDLRDLLARYLVVLGRVHHSELDLLVLELEFHALDRGLELDGSLVPKTLIKLLVAILGGILAGRGDGGKFKGQGKLEMRFGDDLGVIRMQFLPVFQRRATVRNCKTVPLGPLARTDSLRSEIRHVVAILLLIFQRDFG